MHSGKSVTKICQFFLISIEQRKTSLHATANFGKIAVIGWFKFFNWSSIYFLFQKVETFSLRAAREKGNFSKQVDRLTFACRNLYWSILGHCGLVGWDFWPGFGRIRSDFFVFCIDFYYILRNCVKQLRRFFVKSKNENIIWEMLVKLYTDGDIFCVFLFNILWNILQIFMFFVGLLYTLLINNLLITTTDTYRLYIYPIHFTVTNNESVIVIIIKDRLVVWLKTIRFFIGLCVYLIGLKGFTVGEEEISDNWYFCVFVWDFRSTTSNLMNKSLIYLCVSSIFLLSVCVRRAISSHSRRSSASKSKSCFFFVCSYWLNCVFCLFLLCVDNLLLLLLDY